MGSKSDLVYRPQILQMSQNLSDKSSAVNYIFITDIHYGKSAETEQGAALLNQVKAAVSMANSVDEIDFIVIGGDTTTGMYETKEDAIKYTSEVLEPLKNSKKPVFVLMGNHDDNSYHKFTYDVYYPDRIVSDKDWSDNILSVFCPDGIVKDSSYEDSKYYYYDLAGKKTRIICLDAIDYQASYDQNGVISQLPVKNATAESDSGKYWSGCSWWGYSYRQIRWLAEEALTAGDDWDYVFVSHMGIDYGTNCYNSAVQYGNELRSIISAYQNQGVFSYQDISADFSNKSGRILSYQFGHIHSELTLYSKDINLWQICTATASVAQSTTKALADTSITDKTLPWNILDRQLHSDSEACFDVMSVSHDVIYKYSFGAGSTSELKY